MAQTIHLDKDMAAIVDDEDFDRVSPHRWVASEQKTGNGAFAVRTNIARKTVYLHQLLIGKAPKGMVIDHINGNPLDNQRANLRLVTYQQNCMNRRVRRTNTTGFKGVTWHKKNGYWTASIKVNGKYQRKYGFPSPVAAARWYDQHARLHYGEYASVNFPDGN